MQENTEKTGKQRADEKYQEIRGKLRLRKKMEVKCEQDTGNRKPSGPEKHSSRNWSPRALRLQASAKEGR